MADARESPDFRDPDAVELRVRREAVIRIERILAVLVARRIEVIPRTAVLRGILRIDPAASGPHVFESRLRSDVDHIEERTGIAEDEIILVTRIPRRRIRVSIRRINRAAGIEVRACAVAIVELVKERGFRRRSVVLVVLIGTEKRTAR